MCARPSMAESLEQLAAYARANDAAPVSVPALPAPQPLDDPDDPPVWPAWDNLGGPCTHPTSLAAGPPDAYGSGALLQHFEAHVSNLLGKEAALFCVTGTMAQLIALRLHAHNRNKIFACHPKSHLMLHENNVRASAPRTRSWPARAVHCSVACSAHPCVIFCPRAPFVCRSAAPPQAFDLIDGLSALQIGSPSRPMSLAEIESAFGKHWKQPAALVLELPERELGGQTIPWSELVAIRAWALSKGVRMHLDGARLWEIQPHYRRSFQEIASLFDSVYVSFYKGMQGPTGAMLLGTASFIGDARAWQHRMGGRLWQVWPMVLGAQRALNANLATFAARGDKLREVVAALGAAQRAFVHAHAHDVPQVLVRPAKPATPAPSNDADGAHAASAGASSVAASSSTAVATAAAAGAAPDWEPFFHFVPAVPTCSMVHMHLLMSAPDAESLCAAVRAQEGLGLFARIRGAGKAQCVWEWNMGTDNARVDTSQFVRAWGAFMQLRYEQLRKQALALQL